MGHRKYERIRGCARIMRVAPIGFMVAGLISLAPAASSGNPPSTDDEKSIPFSTEMKTVVLTATDSDGNPIAGAEIYPYALRCTEDTSNHFLWPEKNAGRPQRVLTDSAGQAKVVYPVRFGRAPEWNTTCELTATISHSEFIGTTISEDPRSGEIRVELRAGCRLTLGATDSVGQTVPFAVVMAGPGRSAKWSGNPDGTRQTRAIPDGTWQTILVSPCDDGTHLFSGVLPVRLRTKQAVRIRNLPLKPGIRLVGRLDRSVPRPVKNGQILAHCIPRPEGQSFADENPSVIWQQVVEIQEDGSFEFRSLPREGLVQLITCCDTHVGESANRPREIPKRHGGMFIELEKLDEEDMRNLVVPMTPAGAIRVTVLDPDGQPLPNAMVETQPGKLPYLSGWQILGKDLSSIEFARLQIEPKNISITERYLQTKSRFTARTDRNGNATILGIPLGAQFLLVSHDRFLLAGQHRGQQRTLKYELTGPATKEIIANMIHPRDAQTQSDPENDP